MGLCDKEWDPLALEHSTGKSLAFELPQLLCNFFVILGLMFTVEEIHSALKKSLQSVFTAVMIHLDTIAVPNSSCPWSTEMER